MIGIGEDHCVIVVNDNFRNKLSVDNGGGL